MLKELLKNKNTARRFGTALIFFVAAMLAVYVLFFLVFSPSAAWFANNRDLEANGIKVKVKAPPILKVTHDNDPDATDINLLPDEDDRFIYTETDVTSMSDGLITPGSHGELRYYVTLIGEEGETYKATITPEILNDETYNDYGIKNGYTTAYESQLDVALTLINTHIAFFLEYEDGVYGNVLSADSPLELDLNAGEPVEVRIYWKWIEDVSEVIANEELTEAFAAAPQLWCLRSDGELDTSADYWGSYLDYDTEDERLEHLSILDSGYDNADLMISRVLRRINFVFVVE